MARKVSKLYEAYTSTNNAEFEKAYQQAIIKGYPMSYLTLGGTWQSFRWK